MYKLAVVDDETQVRDALCDFFPWDQVGFEVVGRFNDGKDALEFLSHNKADVVLCDVVMTEMSGLELVRELKAMKHSAKIIFLSGYRDFDFVRQGMSYGVKNYILKPTKYNEIIEIFREMKIELDESHCNHTSKNIEGSDIGYSQKMIDAVKKYIKDNYKEANLEDAARTVCISAPYLSQLFKQITGEKFSDFVMEAKMKKAVELLNDIKFNVSEVSEMVGYTDPRNFSRAFRAFYNKSPNTFRRKV